MRISATGRSKNRNAANIAKAERAICAPSRVMEREVCISGTGRVSGIRLWSSAALSIDPDLTVSVATMDEAMVNCAS